MPGYLLPQEFAYSFESFGFTKHLISWVLVSTPNCQLLVTVTEGLGFFFHFLFLSFSCAIMSNSFCIWNHMGGQLEEDIQKGIGNPKKWMKQELCICSLLPNPPSPQKKTPPPPNILAVFTVSFIPDDKFCVVFCSVPLLQTCKDMQSPTFFIERAPVNKSNPKAFCIRFLSSSSH